MNYPDWTTYLFSDDHSFSEKLAQVLHYQLEFNTTYKMYYGSLREMAGFPPLLPIKAFKETKLLSTAFDKECLLFKSSGTTAMTRATHYVASDMLYKSSIFKGITSILDLASCSFLAYTPGYVENPHSSLIWMLNALISNDSSGCSSFLPLGESIPKEKMEDISLKKRKLVLFGAAFGLMDMIEKHPLKLPEGSLIIETGGMKTFRREMTREDLHAALSVGFGIPKSDILSEYGMCELMSQAYTRGGFRFYPPQWMQAIVLNPEDPFEAMPFGIPGQLGIIDLANVYSCPFILTEDSGTLYEDGSFEVHGRLPKTELRGCNFLIDKD